LGRLSALTLIATLGASALSGCENKKEAPPAPKQRNVAVVGKAQASAPPTATEKPAEPKAPRVLCKGKLDAPKELPAPELDSEAAAGAEPVPEQLAVSGKWTWVNFWAAWCVPCKEEIPRLVKWEQQLNEAGTPFALAFLSLDDDRRQLKQFLKDQPKDGLRSTHWLKDPDDREKWLDKAGVGADPELPAHLILDPQGKLRCIIHGAVEDGDYDQVARLLK
jgi:thiol-disulfide isomerase/thioredoxin